MAVDENNGVSVGAVNCVTLRSGAKKPILAVLCEERSAWYALERDLIFFKEIFLTETYLPSLPPIWSLNELRYSRLTIRLTIDLEVYIG